MENLPHDAHTHTTFSAGRSTVEENVRAAQAAGVECVAITDHFYSAEHRASLAERIATVRQVDAESPIKVIIGLEGVILDTEGNVSVTPEDAAQVDWVLVDFGGLGADPRYWIAPDWWIRYNIFRTHQAYRAHHGGQRAQNPDSTHHAIQESRLTAWQGRCDILGIFE